MLKHWTSRFIAIVGFLTAFSSALFVSCAKQQSGQTTQDQGTTPETQLTRKQLLVNRLAPFWRDNVVRTHGVPLGHAYCGVKRSDIADALTAIYPELPRMGSTTGLAFTDENPRELEDQGKLLEAAWAYEDLGNLRMGQNLRDQVFNILNSDSYTIDPRTLGGTFPKKLLVFPNQVSGIYKYEDDRGTFHLWQNSTSEIAAYRLDQLLQTHLVPTTIFKALDNTQGSIIYFVTGAHEPDLDFVRAKNFSTLKVFDYITGNRDRKPENALFSEEKLRVYGIDNGGGFIAGQTCGELARVLEFLRDDPKLMTRIMEVKDSKIRRTLRTLPHDIVQEVVDRVHLLREAISHPQE